MENREGNLFRALNADMRAGLKDIYQQISSASATTDAMFSEASSQLNEVVKATETAAMNIMDIVEEQLQIAEANSARIKGLMAAENHPLELDQMLLDNEGLIQALTSVITALSFQDITGQRIKKAVSALKNIEKSVVDLYLSSGLALEAAEKNPGKDADDIHAEALEAVNQFHARQTGSQLKGPDSSGVSQEAIDAMLAQLGK